MNHQNIKLLIFLLFISLHSFSKELKTGDVFYLNGCNSQEMNQEPVLYSKPLEIGNLSEIPNKIISTNKNPYGSKYETISSSNTKIKNNIVNVTLENLRDLTFTDDDGKILYKHKVSGPSSLYQIKLNDSVHSWAVGWHNYCGIYYTYINFTILRVFTPVIVDGKLTIENKLLKGVYPSKNYESKYIAELSNSKKSNLIIATEEIMSSNKINDCYYCLPVHIFKLENGGLQKIESFDEFHKDLDLNKFSKSSPSLYIAFLSYFNQLDEIRVFVKRFYDEIFQDSKKIRKTFINMNKTSLQKDESLLLEKINNPELKDKCMEQANNFNIYTPSQIGEQCFPILDYDGYFMKWMFDKKYLNENYVKAVTYLIKKNTFYPYNASKSSIEGNVDILLYVNQNGDASKLEILTTSGSELLDQAALSTVRNVGKLPIPPKELFDNKNSIRILVPFDFKCDDLCGR